MPPQRIAAIAAGGFTIAYLAASVLLGDIMGALGDADYVFTDHYASGERRAGDIAGGALLVVAGIFFLMFGAALRPHLGSGLTPMVAERMIGVAAIFIALTGGLFATTPLSISFDGMFDDTGQFGGGHAAVLPQAAAVILLLVAYPFAAVAAGATALSARAAGLPRWYVWLSLLCAVLMPFAFFFFPIIALPIWSAATALVLWRADDRVP